MSCGWFCETAQGWGFLRALVPAPPAHVRALLEVVHLPDSGFSCPCVRFRICMRLDNHQVDNVTTALSALSLRLAAGEALRAGEAAAVREARALPVARTRRCMRMALSIVVCPCVPFPSLLRHVSQATPRVPLSVKTLTDSLVPQRYPPPPLSPPPAHPACPQSAVRAAQDAVVPLAAQLESLASRAAADAAASLARDVSALKGEIARGRARERGLLAMLGAVAGAVGLAAAAPLFSSQQRGGDSACSGGGEYGDGDVGSLRGKSRWGRRAAAAAWWAVALLVAGNGAVGAALYALAQG